MKFKVIWIDDNDRTDESHQINILSKKKLSVSYYHPVKFQKLSEPPDCDLFLVDYKLCDVNYNNEVCNCKGISYIGYLRELYDAVPIYLYSQDDKTEIYNRLLYIALKDSDDVIKYNDIIDNGYKFIYNDLVDYVKIKSCNGELEKLINLLNPPSEEIERIQSILPEILYDKKHKYLDKNLEFAKYIRHEFLQKPGFLYDEDFLSVFLGVKNDILLKHIDEFKHVLYNGIFFKRVEKKRWWKLFIIEKIRKKSKLNINIQTIIKKS